MKNSLSIACWLGLLTLLCGCTPTASTEESTPPAEKPPAVSTVPLRIVCVANVTDAKLVERQWLAGSEQPLTVRPMSVEQFLSGDDCDADVVLYPAYLTGELLARDWVVKLPEMLETNSQSTSGATAGLPPAWQAETMYDGVTYAVPLGCSIPVLIVSDSLASQLGDAQFDWEQGLPRLATASEPSAAVESIDAHALVDRFLAIAYSLSERNARYGLLFDIKTMQPALNEPEFLRAAEILRRLSQQPNGLTATTGSHAAAWQWAAENSQPVASLASLTAVGEAGRQIGTGQVIPFPADRYLNAGGGLVAALSANCRQTRQSTEFLRWLGSGQTRAALTPLISGMDSSSGLPAEALARRVDRLVSEVSQSNQLPQEPRLPGAHRYRQALAEALVAYLQDQSSAEQLVQQVSQQWTDITAEIEAQSKSALRLEYQRSLGLTQ